MCKRIIDIVFSLLGLLLAAPLMLLIALAIRIESPGNIIFSQKRLGIKGKHFLVHKFRKFPSDWGNAGPGVTMANDARMTRVGKFIERTKLDELPQLWNILLGQMSFVGPRPESLKYADLFQEQFNQVLDHVPGIFGPNQISFRNESELYPSDQDPEIFYRTVLFPKKATQDLKYFAKANCFTDLVLIFQGVWVSLIGVANWQRLINLHSAIILLDIIVIEFAWYASNWLRFGFNINEAYISVLITGTWLFPLILTPAMIILGNYRHPVRYFSLHDAARLIKIVSFCLMVSYFIMMFLYRYSSIILLPFTLIIALPFMIVPRILYRERWLRSRYSGSKKRQKIPVLFYGAGSRGTALISLLERGFPRVEIIGFIDDEELIRGRFISKYKMIGCERDLDTLYTKYKFEQLWVTFIPSKSKYCRLKNWCESHNVTLIVPFIMEPFAQIR